MTDRPAASAYNGTLTPEQLAVIDAVSDRFLAAGLSTQRVDRPAAEAAVRRAYAAAGLTPPGEVIWADSPVGGIAAAGHPSRLPLEDGLRYGLRDRFWDQLEGKLGKPLAGRLVKQIEQRTWDELQGQLGNQLSLRLWGQIQSQARFQSIHQFRYLSLWQDAHMLAVYATALAIAGIPDSRITALADATRALDWCWHSDRGPVLTDRPTAIHRDGQGRLHHETGPALTYADGYSLHAWHGIPVPADLIEGRPWTAKKILRHGNAEVRRCAIEHMGWDRFVRKAGLDQVGLACPDPGNPGHELTLYDIPRKIFRGDVRVLICTNGSPDRDGTRRSFGLTVPGNITNPVAAAAWTYGCTVDEYAGLARRT